MSECNCPAYSRTHNHDWTGDEPMPMQDSFKINLSKMFRRYEPWDCSNSQANLGPRAAHLTWQCCLGAAADGHWLVNPAEMRALLLAIAERMREYGWEQEAIDDMGPQELRAYLVQEIAHDLREHTNVDHVELGAARFEDIETGCVMTLEQRGPDTLASVYLGF